jgi:hypothetical protein
MHIRLGSAIQLVISGTFFSLALHEGNALRMSGGNFMHIRLGSAIMLVISGTRIA